MSPAREAVTTVAGKAVGPVGYGMLGKYFVSYPGIAI